MGEDNEGKREKVGQRMCTKDTWTKPKGGRIKGGEWGWMVVRGN